MCQPLHPLVTSTLDLLHPGGGVIVEPIFVNFSSPSSQNNVWLLVISFVIQED